MLLHFLTLTLLLLQTSAKVSYDGFKVLRTSVPTADQNEALIALMEREEFDFWTFPTTKTPVDIMASEERLGHLEKFLQENNLHYELKVPDVQRLIEESEVKVKKSRDEEAEYELTFDDYYKSDVIYEYLDYLASKYDFVSTERLGTTYEGRDIVVLKIEKAGAGKKNVFIEAMSHGREWISTAVATYLIHELVENNEAHADYLDNLNVYVIPIFNPDGYDYSHDAERLWRKTRTQVYSSECLGTDLNRNFPYAYGLTSSDEPCSEFFHGNGSISEVESIALADFFLSLDPIPELAFSFHSARGVFLYPYSSGTEDFPDNVDENIELCEEAVEALNEVDNQEFVCFHSGSGGGYGGLSADWVASVGTRFSYITALRDNGYGFLLPPEYIEPSGRETFAGLKVTMDKLLED